MTNIDATDLQKIKDKKVELSPLAAKLMKDARERAIGQSSAPKGDENKKGLLCWRLLTY